MPFLAYRAAAAGVLGIDKRTSIDTAFTASAPGGWPRPSLIWQFWQALVLNNGPKPSREVVVAGAITQGLRKKLLPTLKSKRRVGAKLAEGKEKALASNLLTVVVPPGNRSCGSKSLRSVVACAMTKLLMPSKLSVKKKFIPTTYNPIKIRTPTDVGILG